MNTFNKLLRSIGASVLDFCSTIGRIVILHVVPYLTFFAHHFMVKNYFTIYANGFYSLPVVGLTALFTGAALALQIYSGGARFSAESVVPSIVAIGMVRELGPVLGGLM